MAGAQPQFDEKSLMAEIVSHVNGLHAVLVKAIGQDAEAQAKVVAQNWLGKVIDLKSVIDHEGAGDKPGSSDAPVTPKPDGDVKDVPKDDVKKDAPKDDVKKDDKPKDEPKPAPEKK